LASLGSLWSFRWGLISVLVLHLGRFGSVLACSWDTLGYSGESCRQSWGGLERSWVGFGRSCADLGVISGPHGHVPCVEQKRMRFRVGKHDTGAKPTFGAKVNVRKACWVVLGGLELVFGWSWAVLEASWSRLGRSWSQTGSVHQSAGELLECESGRF